MKKMKSVREKDRMLLINSKILEDYPWLKELLEHNKKLSVKQILLLHEEKRNFFLNMFDTVMKQAVGEWRVSDVYPAEDMGEDESEWIRCSLCGTPNRYIFYINNTLNGSTMNVGSECRKYFGIDTSKNGLSATKLLKEAKRIKRLEQINKKFPGIAYVISSWSNKLEEFEILIPSILDEPYESIGRELDKLYEDFMTHKANEDVFDEIAEKFRLGETCLVNIRKYVEESSGKKFITKRQIVNWLRRKGDYDTINKLKASGEIDWATSHRITEPNFMNLMLKELNTKLNQYKVSLIKAEHDSEGYVYIYLPQNKIRLLTRHKDIVLNYGGLVFGDELIEPFRLAIFIKNSRIADGESKEFMANDLKIRLKSQDVNIRSFDAEMDEIVFHEIKKERYVITNMSKTLELFKEITLEIGTTNVADLVDYINKLDAKRYSLKEILDIEEVRKNF